MFIGYIYPEAAFFIEINVEMIAMTMLGGVGTILGPVIGSVIGLLKRPSFSYIRNMLCFAAGVMLAISLLERIPNGCAGTKHQTIFSLMIGFIFAILLGLI